MAGAALHKEINAMWSRVILPGCKNSLFTVLFLSQIKMSIMSLPCMILLSVPHSSLQAWVSHCTWLITSTISNQDYPKNQTHPIDKLNVNPSSEIFKLKGTEAALRFNIRRQITIRQYCKKPYP